MGEKYNPAMEVQTQAEADAYFDKCVEHSMALGTAREEAERVERMNLGYCAGYYSNEVRARVERLFRCEHPIFGAIAVKGPPTPDEAFAMGVRWASEVKNKS